MSPMPEPHQGTPGPPKPGTSLPDPGPAPAPIPEPVTDPANFPIPARVDPVDHFADGIAAAAAIVADLKPETRQAQVTAACDKILRAIPKEKVARGAIHDLGVGHVVGLRKPGYLAVIFDDAEVKVFRVLKFQAPTPAADGKEAVAGNDYVLVDQFETSGLV